VEEGRAEPAALAGLPDDGVHLAVDADAPVAGALEGLLGEPVVPVPAAQHLDQTVAELGQLGLRDIPAAKADQVDEEITR